MRIIKNRGLLGVFLGLSLETLAQGPFLLAPRENLRDYNQKLQEFRRSQEELVQRDQARIQKKREANSTSAKENLVRFQEIRNRYLEKDLRQTNQLRLNTQRDSKERASQDREKRKNEVPERGQKAIGFSLRERGGRLRQRSLVMRERDRRLHRERSFRERDMHRRKNGQLGPPPPPPPP